MADYCITTDATIDLKKDVVDELDVRVIPMDFMLDGVSYKNHPASEDMPLSKFYEELKLGKPASTSQISPASYEEFFEEILKEGKDIIYIALSSGLSGTYSSSCLIARDLMERYPDRKIICIDSLCASIGEGLLVYYAAKKKQSGVDIDECAAYIEETKAKVCHWFMVEDLEQLKRGGRINSLEAVLGAALHIRPILSTDPEGKLRVMSKVRGSKKGISYIKEKLKSDAYDSKSQTVIIAHGNCLEYAEELKTEIIEEGLVKEVILSEVGPVIGSHTGTGMCALVFIGENWQ